MPILLLFRDSQKINPFRKIFISCIQDLDWDKMFLSSWYIRENIWKNKNLAYSFYDDIDTKIWLISSFSWKDIELFWVHWHKQRYEEFLKSLKNSNWKNIKVSSKYNRQYHAKVFILFKWNIPICWIIWSSNLTWRAFWDSSINWFNHEADVFIYSTHIENQIKKFSFLREIENTLDWFNVVKVNYDEEFNKNINADNHLENIYKNIKKIFDNSKSI